MTSTGPLHYHHDRADWRGTAILTFWAGLVALGIALPIVYKTASQTATLICAGIGGLVWLAVAGFYAYRARAACGRTEIVHVDDTGFDSRLYGRVAFGDVRHYRAGHDSGLLRWEISAPSLSLRLANGRRLAFHLDARHYHDDLLDYLAFVEAVLAHLPGEQGRLAATLPGRAALFGEKPTRASPAADDDTNRSLDTVAAASRSSNRRRRRRTLSAGRVDDTPTDKMPRDSASQLSRANEAASQRFRTQMARHRKWMVLAGAAIPLSFGIRACDLGWIKPGPLDGAAERAPVVLEYTTNRLQRAVAEEGPVYLWHRPSGDPLKPVLAPNINSRQIGNDILDMMSTASGITDFLAGDAAEGYRMALQHNDGITVSRYSAISLRPVAGEHTLSFFLLPPPGLAAQDSNGPGVPNINWRIRYRQTSDIPAQLDEGSPRLPMSLMTRWLKMTPAPRLVVAASRYHGMTAADFKAAIDIVADDLADRGIDTSGFVIQRFTDGTVNQTGAPARDARNEPHDLQARDVIE